jgi:lactate racemase
MRLELQYGTGKLFAELPLSWQTKILDHGQPGFLDMAESLGRALEEPVGEKPFGDWLRFRKILIIVPDITRYNGADRFLPLLYEQYFKDRDVTVLFALGNHRKQTAAEMKGLVSDFIFERVPCLDHDCYDRNRLTLVGVTKSGLDVVINSALVEAEAAIVTGSIGFHYLAGYGGGRKAIFPGVAGYQSIIGIHKKVFRGDGPGKDPRARSGILDGNPMHEEIMEAISFVKTPMFLINTVLDDRKQLLGIFAGHVREAHAEGCRWYARNFAVSVEEKADVVILSGGGFPKDINFIQAHKALEHGIGAVKPGGTLIVAGRCQDGLGHDDFIRWFDYGDSAPMEEQARKSDKVYAQTAFATRLKAEYCTIVFISDLDDETVRRMGLIPKKSLADAVVFAETKGPKTCYVIPDGAHTLALYEGE